jgi:L-iditol 2-dehydrogenase
MGSLPLNADTIRLMTVPDRMQAAVYRGPDDVRIETVPVPELEPGEVLVRVDACGVCGTDVKKVKLGLVEPPRIFGHETAGTVAEVAEGTEGFQPGDRVAMYHHIPDPNSWYGRRELYAQCPQYLRTGITAGFEPAGGGYAEYARVMPWIVKGGGLVLIPDGVSAEEAAFVEPVNTCLKGIRAMDLDEEEQVLVVGLGSIGLLMMQLAIREGARVIASDPLPGRRARAREFGATEVLDPGTDDISAACRKRSEGRGVDHAIVCAPGAAPVADAIAATRPGAGILLFASTRRGEEVAVDIGELCMGEKRLFGSYSASVDLNEEAARIVFEREIELAGLVTHRYPLTETGAAIERAASADDDVCKVMVRVRDADR